MCHLWREAGSAWKLASKSASDEETKKKMKETKRRSDKCYGCSFCEYYCSLKECEFCASMLRAVLRRVDKNMGDIRTKGRTKTKVVNIVISSRVATSTDFGSMEEKVERTRRSG